MRRRTIIRIISYSLSFCAVALGAAVMGFSQAGEYKTSTKNVHMSAFAQLVTGISKLNTAFEKSLCCGTNGMSATLCAEIWRQSAEAKAALSLLPLEYGELEKTQKFISQSGEYAYTLLKKTASGHAFDRTDRENIKSLKNVSNKLALELSAAEYSLRSGKKNEKSAKFFSGRDESAESKAVSADEQNENFPEYASLIYDGPFSEHIDKRTPALLEKKQDLTEQQARSRAAEILGINKDRLKNCADGNGKIKTYCFSDGHKETEITKQGGYLLNYTNQENSGGQKITAEYAVKNAKAFMETCGYYGMSESYYMISGGIITINFAYKTNGTVYYTDLIKVSVFLDGGQIAALESYGYIMSHRERTEREPEITLEQAKKSLCADLKLLSGGLCVIPTRGQNEILCYEFKTETEDKKHCIVYVNAETGEEENIFILIEDKNGTLAV